MSFMEIDKLFVLNIVRIFFIHRFQHLVWHTVGRSKPGMVLTAPVNTPEVVNTGRLKN